MGVLLLRVVKVVLFDFNHIFICRLMISAQAQAGESRGPEIEGMSSITERNSGKIYMLRMKRKRYPASTTKIPLLLLSL